MTDWERFMRTFTGFIRDDRYSTVTLRLFTASGDEQACQIARRDLDANPHHRSFEVRDDTDRLILVERRPQR